MSHRRSRSPEYTRRSARDEGYRPSRNGRDARDYDGPVANNRSLNGQQDREARRQSGTDRGHSERSDRHRDSGYGGRIGDGYTSRDRERERRDQRAGYNDRARKSISPPPRKEPPKPNFGNSGLLAAETNTVTIDPAKAAAAGKTEVKGVLLKYNEPPEARKPTKKYRLYVFKGDEQVDMIPIYNQSAFLIGRDKLVTDIPIDHPSASKQHSVIQYRQISEKNDFGDISTHIKPFVIDLESTNGTFVNHKEIPTSRYYEIKENDILKFAESTREYVFLAEDGDSH